MLSRTRPCLLLLLLVPALPAQWASLPKNPAQSVYSGNWYVAHDTGSGVAAFSAVAQQWTTVSPTGSTVLRAADAALLTRESPTLLRGWSAYSNSSAPQAVSTNVAYTSNGYDCVLVQDNAPATFGVMRAYSALTNTWASFTLAQLATNSALLGQHVVLQRDGNDYRAFSSYTGQWHTFTASVAAGNMFIGPDYAAVDLRGTSGPFQFAAFSARRGTWTLSPNYPTSGPAFVQTSDANAMAIRVDTGNPATFVYAGYSPTTGHWNQSSLVHSTSSSVSTIAYKNVVRIQDSSPAARYEIFGAGNGVWQSITGTNLVEDSLHEDFHVVKNSSLSSTIVYAASALVGGGYASITLPTPYPGISQGAHCCIVSDATAAAYAYTAATNSFLPGVPQQPFGNVSQACSGTVGGFTMQGSAASGTNAQAFSARWGNWVAGPAISPSDSWMTYAGGALLVAVESTFPGYQLAVYDEHRNAWNATVNAGSPSWLAIGQNALAYPSGANTINVYSVHRGTWSAHSGIGAITSGAGTPTVLENILWFTDTNNLIWVCALSDRTQSWEQWPVSPQFATSGATPGGATPSFGVSMSGTPSQFALLYASLGLAPSPVSIPGILGTLDLDPLGAVQIAAPGLFDADGVLEARIPLPSVAPPSTQLWMQLVTVDLLTGQIEIAGRATGTRFF
jgi:hypothetical protein